MQGRRAGRGTGGLFPAPTVGFTRRMLCDVQRVPINHDGAIRLIHLERESDKVRPKRVGKFLLWLQAQPLPREVFKRE